MRVRNHIGTCFLMHDKPVWKQDYLTPEERREEQHYQELLKQKEYNNKHLFR